MPSTPFDNIATIYDDQFTNTRTGYLQRQLVYIHLEKILEKNGPLRVLELNCGTGADAIWLARKGCQVLATDISKGMIATATAKKESLDSKVKEQLIFKTLAIEQIAELETEAPFDLIFSNFGGLNCISPQEMKKIATTFNKILSDKGQLIFVIMSRFSWWESIYFLVKFNWKQAWRRQSKTAIEAPLAEGVTIKTWYYSPNEMIEVFSPYFHLKHKAPIGFFLPPSYLDQMFSRWPWVLKLLWYFEKKIKHSRFLAAQGDHFLVEFEIGFYLSHQSSELPLSNPGQP